MAEIRFQDRRQLFWLLPASIFLILAVMLWVSVSGNLASISSDFDFYNHSIVKNFSGHISDLSRQIDSESIRVARSESLGWTPSPVYGLVFLWPIWLLGSQEVFWLLGVSVGIVCIWSAVELFAKLSVRLSGLIGGILLLSLPLNFNFIVDAVGVSTMSVMASLVLLGFAINNRLARALLLVFAATIRANYIFFALAVVIAIFVFRPKGGTSILIDLAPSFCVWLVFYSLYFSTYPGGGLNYLFWTFTQGIDYSQEHSLEFLGQVLGIKTERELFTYKMSFFDVINILRLPEAWSFLVSSFSLKMSIILGFTHEKLFESVHEIFVAKIWRIAYFLLISLPGLYCMCLSLASPNLASSEKAIYLGCILYLSMNAVLIGDPRYAVGVHFFLSLAVVRILDVVFGRPNARLNMSNHL